METKYSIKKLNNLIKSIESSKKNRPNRKKNIPNFDDINLNNLNLEFVVGSKINIQSGKSLEAKVAKSSKKVMLESYLENIAKYKNTENRVQRHKANFDDLNLDINLEVNQKYLVSNPEKLTKTPLDIKRDITITLLENLKTYVFLYKNTNKTSDYKAKFSDLNLDIELEYTKNKINKSDDITSKGINAREENLSDNFNKITNTGKINILNEKLENIKKSKEKSRKQVYNNNLSNKNFDLSITLTKSGEQMISVNRQNKINKLKQLLKSINSYKENRNGLHS